jgi:hypothetical protein
MASITTDSSLLNVTPINVPKKRGRKPNILKQQELEANIANESLSPTLPKSNVGRKKKNNLKYTASSMESCKQKSNGVIDETFHSQDTPLILHLNVNCDDNFGCSSNDCLISDNTYETDFYEYNPEIKEPIAYEDHHSDKFQSTPESYKLMKQPSVTHNSTSIEKYFDIHNPIIDDISKRNMELDTITKRHDPSEKKNLSNNIVLLKNMISNEEWCNNTSYWCYWDCHSFDNPPFGIPIKYNNGKFHVYGCFCSLECAVAYNFYSNENMDNVWENFNLLNMMSNMMSYKLTLNSAISRKCLNVFGGPLNIEKFREKSIKNSKFNILTYPMVSIVEHVEEINESSSYDNKMNGIIPLDRNRVSKIEDTNRVYDNSIYKSKTILEETMKLKFTQ